MILENVTSLRISLELKKRGFKQESLFFHTLNEGEYAQTAYYGFDLSNLQEGGNPEYISAFTISELLGFFPDGVSVHKKQGLTKFYSCFNDDKTISFVNHDSPCDALAILLMDFYNKV